MPSATLLKPITVEDYLRGERDVLVRHEYLNGELRAMAGGSRARNLTAGRVARLLGNHLEGGPCRVYQSDMKVRIDAANRFYYPDVMVCCNSLAEEPDEYYESSPTLIVEVLSPAIRHDDDGEKRINYQTLPSLQEYLLLDPKAGRGVLYRRVAEGWERWELAGEERLELACVGFEAALMTLFPDLASP